MSKKVCPSRIHSLPESSKSQRSWQSRTRSSRWCHLTTVFSRHPEVTFCLPNIWSPIFQGGSFFSFKTRPHCLFDYGSIACACVSLFCQSLLRMIVRSNVDLFCTELKKMSLLQFEEGNILKKNVTGLPLYMQEMETINIWRTCK